MIRWHYDPNSRQLGREGKGIVFTTTLIQARRFLEIFGGVQLNNQNIFWKISRILFAQLVIVDFVCIVRLYVAIAHLMQFCFFFGVKPFRKQAYGILEKEK